MKTTDKLITNLARTLAEKCHHGQKYGDEDYFDHHIIGVVNECVYLFDQYPDRRLLNYTECICVAFLHDIMEDCNITKRALWELFGGYIATVVDILTKKKNENRTEYLFRVSQNPLAKFVKICDARFNKKSCIDNGDEKRAKYYEDTITFLEEC